MSAVFLAMLKAAGLPEPATEHRFHPTRKWRFDYAWPEHKVALEVEGAVWTHGRHTRGSGFVKDMEKYNTAAVLGWMVLRVQTKELTNGAALDLAESGLYERSKNS
jgi:very-short-patch-repair endonuclease